MGGAGSDLLGEEEVEGATGTERRATAGELTLSGAFRDFEKVYPKLCT